MAQAHQHFEFINVSPRAPGKPQTAQRRKIRSHCMRGRNRRNPSVWLPKDDINLDRTVIEPNASLPSHEQEGSQVPTVNNRARVKSPVLSLPSLVDFAVKVDNESLRLLATVFPGTMSAFSLARFRLPSHFRSSQWSDWLLSDKAYVYSILAVCAVIQEFLLAAQRSKHTALCIRTAISQLNERLSSHDTSLSNARVANVIALTLAALVSNDHVAMSIHGNGLRHIVQLRGGLESFRGNPQILVVLSRIDLCVTLSSGLGPLFPQYDPVSVVRDLLKPHPQACLPLSSRRPVIHLLDPRLVPIFLDLQYLAWRINMATNPPYEGIQEYEVHAGIWVAQYRLWQLQGTMSDILGECLRVSMLGFLTTMFSLMNNRIGYDHTNNQLRVLCCAIEVSTQQLRPVMLWVLMVGTLALFDPGEEWLLEKWRSGVLPLIQELQWMEVREYLKDFLWIDSCNDTKGEILFEKLGQLVRAS
ncbi:unnamed protein product [Clonostachys rosea]|uniref:Transcription factor domain-containing protein n=1 Tax=Bionectria ochroleuca TaxID=29856 RepID=A0ABY6UIZ1_BIOOC|nr:unnamed protein product [Clonostachys rosea]